MNTIEETEADEHRRTQWVVEAAIERSDGKVRPAYSVKLTYSDAVRLARRIARTGSRAVLIDPRGGRSRPVKKLS